MQHEVVAIQLLYPPQHDVGTGTLEKVLRFRISAVGAAAYWLDVEARAGGLRCSVKALQVDDERAAVRDYRKAAATEGLGTFADLLRAKLDTPAK